MVINSIKFQKLSSTDLDIKVEGSKAAHYPWWSSAPQPVPQKDSILFITLVQIPWGFGGKASILN
jgi:hypothetical protein